MDIANVSPTIEVSTLETFNILIEWFPVVIGIVIVINVIVVVYRLFRDMTEDSGLDEDEEDYCYDCGEFKEDCECEEEVFAKEEVKMIKQGAVILDIKPKKVKKKPMKEEPTLTKEDEAKFINKNKFE